MKSGQTRRRYSALWSSDGSVEDLVVADPAPADQLGRARELCEQGYHPVANSVVQPATDEPAAAVSVWHRPVDSEAELDAPAERQARAAVSLIRLGRAEVVWPRVAARPRPAPPASS